MGGEGEKVHFLGTEHQHHQGMLCSRQTGGFRHPLMPLARSLGTPPAPCPPQGRSSREDLLGSGATHRDSGSAPVLEPIQQLVPALCKEERCEEEGQCSNTIKPQCCHGHRAGVAGQGDPGWPCWWASPGDETLR